MRTQKKGNKNASARKKKLNAQKKERAIAYGQKRDKKMRKKNRKQVKKYQVKESEQIIDEQKMIQQK